MDRGRFPRLSTHQFSDNVPAMEFEVTQLEPAKYANRDEILVVLMAKTTQAALISAGKME